MNGWIGSHYADGSHTSVHKFVFGPHTHQLRLLPTRQRILYGRARGHRHFSDTNDASHPRHRGIFLHLANQPVRDVATAQLSLVQTAPFLELGIGKEDAPLTQRKRRGAERARNP
ncbi:MAG: hypothetical protein AUH82_02135 [Chloroflexi bacterium 13_1_40CM_4_65_13]|nr:MAG: hypothetical protein AUH82_02135 [Chloroflexi bacterium 13_1_40CM_4_65_13]